MTTMRVQLILASKSPRRRALLKTLGIPFRVMPSGASEVSSQKNPQRLVQELAVRKAKAVAAQLKEGLVLGADTLVFLGNQKLGQPKNAKDAYRMLYRLSGSTHRVITGVALWNVGEGTSRVTYEVSKVRMKKLPVDALLRLSHKHLDKAGSYAIQSKNDPIAEVVSGTYDNVVGLPLKAVKQLLKPYRLLKTSPRRRIPS
jgi:septum formation protein